MSIADRIGRMLTRGSHLARELALEAAGRPLERVVFLHIPKCAGSTIIRHLRRRIGTVRSGRMVHLLEPALMPGFDAARARLPSARFVAGHFGRGVFDLVRDGAFSFTFLREPRARLRSHYRYFSASPDPDWRIDAESYLDFLTRDEIRFVRARDNLITRVLGAALEPDGFLAVPRETWRARADKTLGRMRFIGFQDRFDADFDALMRALRLPPRRPEVVNVTEGMPGTHGFGATPAMALGDAELAAETRCLEMDLDLYARWRARVDEARP